MADNKSNAELKISSSNNELAPIVIDLGKQARKKVKSLLRGEGRLFGEVQCAVDELRETGKIKKDVQLVFVNVQKKRRKKDLINGGLGLCR